jgi:phospholipase/carboxylesterase
MSGAELSRPHVWRPSSDIKANRTLLLLHGTGADEYDLLNLGRALDQNANLLSPRGLVSENGMNRFFIRFSDGSFDENSIRENVDELAAFIRKASLHYGFSLDSVVAVGFSNGANTAGALITLHPDTVAGIVAFGTTKAFEVTPGSPNLNGKFVFIANGEQDSYSPKAKTEAMVSEFTVFGANVTVLLHPGGHQISPDHVSTIAKALSN